MDCSVRIAEEARDRWSVVEVDDGRRGAAGGDDVRLVVVADERCHLVAVLVQFGEDMRSDEPGCTGERNFHGETGSCPGNVVVGVPSKRSGWVSSHCSKVFVRGANALVAAKSA